MNSTSLKPLVEELRQQDFNKADRREFIELLSIHTQDKVSDILQIKGRDAYNIKYFGAENIEISSCDISDCLEVSQAAEIYADYLESHLSTLEISKILHEQQNSTLNLRTNQRIPRIGNIHFGDKPYNIDLNFEDEKIGNTVGKIEISLPVKGPNQKITFEVSLKEKYNIHQANMDILALKNIMKNKDGAPLIQSRLENIMRKYTDSMTGLYNGMFVEETLTKPDHDYSFIFIDISRFKEINDSNGQKIGDEAIKKVAKLLEGACRIEDKVCRLGGDEFAILFNSNDENQIKEFIQRIESKDISIVNEQKEEISINLKFGYSINDGNNKSHSDLLTTANEMLNQNKDKRGAAYRFKSMLLEYDDETRVYALWELMSDPESLDYVFEAILTEPATDMFLDKFGGVLKMFLSGNLEEINPQSRKSLENFTEKFNISQNIT